MAYRHVVMAVCGVWMMSTHAYALCATPAGSEGDLHYDTVAKAVFFCNGASWQKIGGPPAFQLIKGPIATAGCLLCDITKTSTATCPPGMQLVTGDCHFNGESWPYAVNRTANSYSCSITINLLAERSVYSEATCM